MCSKPKRNRQKQVTFTPKQFPLEGAGFKKTTKEIFKGSQKTWDKFQKPAVDVAAPLIRMAVSAKTKNPKIGERKSNSVKSISGGKVLLITDMHSSRLRLKEM